MGTYSDHAASRPVLTFPSISALPPYKVQSSSQKKSHSVSHKLKSTVRFIAQCTDVNLGSLRERPEIIKELPSFVETQAISSLNAAELFKAPIAYLLN